MKFRKALTDINKFAKDNDKTLAIPYKIGCGLAHGNWEVVEEIILNTITVPCTIYRYGVTSTEYEE